MELNELKEKAILLKEENTKLRNEVNAKKVEFSQTIRNNFIKIILPYMQSMNDFIYNLTFGFADKAERIIDDYQKIHTTVEKRLTSCGITLLFKEWKSYGLNVSLTYKDSCNNLNPDQWMPLAELFESVDACNSFIEQLNADYSIILESAINQYETENPALAETLQNLTERIRNSSCVEEKEDGSIEIQINGKTYIGTIKEA